MESQLLIFGEPATFRSVVLFSAAVFVVLIACFLLFRYANNGIALLFWSSTRRCNGTITRVFSTPAMLRACCGMICATTCKPCVCFTNKTPPAPPVICKRLNSHCYALRRIPTAAHLLTLKLDNSNMNDAEAVAFVSFIVNAVDIALESAEPGSEILASTLPGAERGIEVCYQGALLRRNRIKWRTLGTLVATAGGTTSCVHQSGRTLLRAVLPNLKAVV